MRYVSLSTGCDQVEREHFLDDDPEERILDRLLQRRRIWLALLLFIVLITMILTITNFFATEQEQMVGILEKHDGNEHEYTAEELFSFNATIQLNIQPLTEQRRAKVAESYLAQEQTIEFGVSELDNIEQIKLENSDPLPGRLYAGVDPSQMCESGKAQCVHPFAKIRPLIVTSPNHHLMSCLINKSMSTVMSAIFCFLVREKEFMEAGRSILMEYPDIRFCEGKNEFRSVKDMQKGLRLTDHQLDKYHFSMVTREPVDRFLSGFIDRCIRVGDPCFGCGSNITCFLEEEYRRAAEYAYADKNGLTTPNMTLEDIHVFPQNWRCDMREFYNRYQFIRYSSDPTKTLLEDLTPMLRSQNVSESSINYISESLRSGRTAHSTVKSAARVFFEDRIRHSPYLMELIVRLFYYDYKLLNYPLPDLDR